MNHSKKIFILVFLLTFIIGCGIKEPVQKEAFDLAVQSLGGEDLIENLDEYLIKSERDEYIMGQGPEPGKGMMLLAAPTTNVSHKLSQKAIRVDLITTLAAREGGYITREVNTLLLGNEGYLSEDDPMGIVKEKDKVLTPDKAAAAIKTERLLNPHLLINEVLNDLSLLISDEIPNQNKGWRYREDEVFPVTVDRLRQSGLRTLVANEEWEERASKKEFFPKMINKTLIEPDWFKNWKQNTVINEQEYLTFSIKDKVYPITFFINKESGLIDKISTMEWDVVYGDIEIEVRFDDWDLSQDIPFPMTVRMSQGGAPRWEIRRDSVQINPSFSGDHFDRPGDLKYVHNESFARRGWEVSQTMRMFTLSGAYRPKLKWDKLSDGIHYLSALPLDGIYTLVIEQQNGVVVVEPGMNDLKGEEVAKWINANIPNKPITHIIPTHHHNDHGAGIRPYIAEGADLVVHESAIDFYRAQINRPKSSVVIDALDRLQPREAEAIIGVSSSEPYLIDDPERPVTVYPVMNGHVEDMTVSLVGNVNMLYAGDLYISGVARDKRSGTKRGPNVIPYHSAISLNEAIKEFNIPADILLGSHDIEPVSYQDLIDYITD
jgi:glyoxylase-like metal-dependent hydrolase (beta-lactamase superfamily II)|tara:strand:- start:5852 stop:7663 length:1812 start_codon:yes stop_codon:yes gene_type:complete